VADSGHHDHDQALAAAFDGQAARFERAPVQTDPGALARRRRVAAQPPHSLLLDAGCGPGLVSRAFLDAGHRVVGVDLSAEMIDRARLRCPDSQRATFIQGSIYGHEIAGEFDACVSRYVLHHVAEPLTFLARQVELLRPGGIVVLNDHSASADRDLAVWHNGIEVLRDRTHTANLSPGAIVDLFTSVGLESIASIEERFTLDFDEWFDLGTPVASKAEVRARIEVGPPSRGFMGRSTSDGRLEIDCWRLIVRGVKP
jgi:SAM-dependent methyltransferase